MSKARSTHCKRNTSVRRSKKNFSRTLVLMMVIFYIFSLSLSSLIGHINLFTASVDKASTPVSMERFISEPLVFQSPVDDLATLEESVNTKMYDSYKLEDSHSSLDAETEVEFEVSSEIDAQPEVRLQAEPETNIEPKVEPEVDSEIDTEPKVESNFEVPSVLYLHVRDVSRDSDFFWVLEVLDERISDADIAVDMTSLVDPSLALHFSDREFLDICKLVHCESNSEGFLGQLAVAEDFANRYRSPYYGTNIYEIIVNGYLGELDEQGNFHAYDSEGEVIEERISESVKTAVRLALSGSQMTHRLLKAVTEYVNAEYDLQLGSRHFEYGAMYHFAPERITLERQISARSFQKIPVSFLLGDHIFYGYWLSNSIALDIEP